jgi:hypothetical protein
MICDIVRLAGKDIEVHPGVSQFLAEEAVNLIYDSLKNMNELNCTYLKAADDEPQTFNGTDEQFRYLRNMTLLKQSVKDRTTKTIDGLIRNMTIQIRTLYDDSVAQQYRATMLEAQERIQTQYDELDKNLVKIQGYLRGARA